MKPEPLTKEKIRTVFLDSLSITHKAFFFEDVKSAVDLVLKEIEKEQEKLKEQYKKARKNTQRTWIGGAIGGLEIAKDLIKKAFSGVIEE